MTEDEFNQAYLNSSPNSPGPGPWQSGLQGAVQGATLGFTPSTPETIAAQQNHPVAYMTGQVLGSVIPAVATPEVALPSILGKTASQWAGPMLTNAALGGITGFNTKLPNGEYPDLSTRFQNAEEGSGVGAALGTAGKVISKGYGAIEPYLGQANISAANVLRSTANAANDLFNSTRIQAVQAADKIIPGIAQKVLTNDSGKTVVDPQIIQTNISNLPTAQKQLITASHSQILDTNPITKGATNPNEIQRNLVIANQQNPNFFNSPIRQVVEAGMGAGLGYGYSFLNPDSNPYADAALGAAGVLGLTKGAIISGITNRMAQKEANLAVANRALTQPDTLGRVNRGITPYAPGSYIAPTTRAITENAIPFITSNGNSIGSFNSGQGMTEEQFNNAYLNQK